MGGGLGGRRELGSKGGSEGGSRKEDRRLVAEGSGQEGGPRPGIWVREVQMSDINLSPKSFHFSDKSRFRLS